MNKIIQGNCLDSMKLLEANSVDAIVTDPPYGLSFMGKKWDYDVPSTELWTECLRVLKPGGYLLSFAGTRTQHRMAVRVEDAGFEIRDMIAWVYGSGFPKSLNIGKAVDKLQGNEREVIGTQTNIANKGNNNDGRYNWNTENQIRKDYIDITKGTSEWEGWGTALKPALEPITVARKPLSEKTVAENCLKWGTGGIDIDGSRVPLQGNDLSDTICVCQENHTQLNANSVTGKESADKHPFKSSAPENVDMLGLESPLGTQQENTGKQDILCSEEMSVKNTRSSLNTSGSGNERMERNQKDMKSTTSTESNTTTDLKTCSVCGLPTTEVLPTRGKNEESTLEKQGRFPSNLIHDGSDEVVGLFPDSKGMSGGGKHKTTYDKNGVIAGGGHDGNDSHIRGDSGSASRFFYCAKASKSERNRGCKNIDQQITSDGRKKPIDNAFQRGETMRHNNHPTVKPIALMEYLVKLVSKEGAVVLDPFAGSGSTLIACKNLNRNYIGMEMDAEYIKIAEARLE